MRAGGIYLDWGWGVGEWGVGVGLEAEMGRSLYGILGVTDECLRALSRGCAHTLTTLDVNGCTGIKVGGEGGREGRVEVGSEMSRSTRVTELLCKKRRAMVVLEMCLEMPNEVNVNFWEVDEYELHVLKGG